MCEVVEEELLEEWDPFREALGLVWDLRMTNLQAKFHQGQTLDQKRAWRGG